MLCAASQANRHGNGSPTNHVATAGHLLSWARSEKLDIVFNMVRFTDAMLGNGDLSDTCKPLGPKEEQMRQFFLDRFDFEVLMNYIAVMKVNDKNKLELWREYSNPLPVFEAFGDSETIDA